MKWSVIVPTLNEAAELPGALANLAGQEPPPFEILVADGGSHDGSVEALDGQVRLVVSEAGRARQLNAAAEKASGDVLLFLHADCRLPPAALAAAEKALSSPEVVGGAFSKVFADKSPIRAGSPWRSRFWHALGVSFGDQAMFVRRSVFEALGGFDEQVFAEDLALGRLLRGAGQVVLLPQVVQVSSRRLRRYGTWRTWARWWTVILPSLLGRPPKAGARDYPAVRD
jgi:rSAM/selenodomain-associated transferase 2